MSLARINEDRKLYQTSIRYFEQALKLVDDENLKKEIITQLEELQEKISTK